MRARRRRHPARGVAGRGLRPPRRRGRGHRGRGGAAGLAAGAHDETMDALDGTHFDLSGDIRKVRGHAGAARAAPRRPTTRRRRRTTAGPGRPGTPRSAAPASRSGRTSAPGTTRACPVITSRWAAGWPPRDRLSRYQRIEFISGDAEGWALYAERLMDELGFFTAPDRRIGYLDRPAAAGHPGRRRHRHALRAADPRRTSRSTPASAGRPSSAASSCSSTAAPTRRSCESEWIRYLGMPGQAISYKLGERVWLAGRAAARAGAGRRFDLKAWHTAALAPGSARPRRPRRRAPAPLATAPRSQVGPRSALGRCLGARLRRQRRRSRHAKAGPARPKPRLAGLTAPGVLTARPRPARPGARPTPRR